MRWMAAINQARNAEVQRWANLAEATIKWQDAGVRHRKIRMMNLAVKQSMIKERSWRRRTRRVAGHVNNLRMVYSLNEKSPSQIGKMWHAWKSLSSLAPISHVEELESVAVTHELRSQRYRRVDVDALDSLPFADGNNAYEWIADLSAKPRIIPVDGSAAHSALIYVFGTLPAIADKMIEEIEKDIAAVEEKSVNIWSLS